MKLATSIIIYTFLATQLAIAALAQAKPPQPGTAIEVKSAKAADAEPSIDQILDKHVQAIGGRAALEKITSRVIKGTFEVASMGLKGEVEIYSKAPNKILTVQNIPGIGVLRDGYDGKTAWSENPMMGLREKSGTELASVVLQSDFYAPLRTKQRYSKLELKGKEKVGDRECWVILATPAEGSPVKLYYDVQTGLQARVERELDTPQGRIPIQTTLDDYREIDGIKIAFTSYEESSVAKAVIRLTDIKSNVAIEDTKFNKPSGQ